MCLKEMVKVRSFFVFVCGAALLSGCAASRALNKEAAKDYSVLERGTERDLVHAELGMPVISGGTRNADLDSYCDVFAFVEGSGGAKYARAVGYSILAVGTLGISEIVTNPTESAIGDDKVRLRVCYDDKLLVETVEQLEVGKAARQITSGREIE